MKKGKKEGLRKLQEKGIATLIKLLKLFNECNGYSVSYFLPFIDSEKTIWMSQTESVRWHSKCYSMFCNPKNPSSETSQESGPSYDPQEPGPSVSCLSEVGMFFRFKIHHGDKRLITMQYQSVTDNLKK